MVGNIYLEKNFTNRVVSY